MLKYIVLVLPLFCFFSLKSQEISASLTRDSSFIYKGQTKTALYFGTDIGQKAFIQQWKLFLKEKLNTTLKIDSKSKTEISYISKEINSQLDVLELNLVWGFGGGKMLVSYGYLN